MTYSIITLAAGFSIAAALTTTAAASQPDVDNIRHATIDLKWATPSEEEPVAEPEAASEAELMLRGLPDLVNRPKR